MIGSVKYYLCSLLILFSINCNAKENSKIAKIYGGTYTPLYGKKLSDVTVKDFYIDIYPVSNKQYLEFVKKYPEWKKSKVIELFADDNYLSMWIDDETIPKNISPDAPVVDISWYAAKAYCECQDMRLSTVDEWEYVARADETDIDATKDRLYTERIIKSYETPRTYTHNIGSTYRNYWGVFDMHGLVWEWTLDFNSIMISGENRSNNDLDRNLFCAAGSIGASDLMNYAAFMRYAFRGSLKANFCIRNLGFRCAKDIEKN